MSGRPVFYEANEIMNSNEFPHGLMRVSRIWAAKHRKCPKCNQPPYTPCLNLNDVKRAEKNPSWPVKNTRDPHTERVDWDLLVRTLHERGFKKRWSTR